MAMRLGPGTAEWRSVPMDKGVVMGPTTCAGCQSSVPLRACQELSLGMRRSVPSCAVMRRERGEGCGDGCGGDLGFGEDFYEDFVVAGRPGAVLEEWADLFPVEGAPGFVLAGDDAVDGCYVISGADDVEAGAHWLGVEMEGVAEFGGGTVGDFFGVRAGEP